MTQSTTVPTVEITQQTTHKNVKFIAGGVIITLAVIYLIYAGVAGNSAYFLTVDELYAKGAAIENRTVRIAGMVEADSINFDNRNLILTFDITSETGQRLPVIFNGPKPDQMRQGAEAIVEGKYNGELFNAQSLLLKCPSRYNEESL